jgi:hypothetical protein
MELHSTTYELILKGARLSLCLSMFMAHTNSSEISLLGGVAALRPPIIMQDATKSDFWNWLMAKELLLLLLLLFKI